jgi:hypothetical protein
LRLAKTRCAADLRRDAANLLRAAYAAGRDERASDVEFEARGVDGSAEMAAVLESARALGAAIAGATADGLAAARRASDQRTARRFMGSAAVRAVRQHVASGVPRWTLRHRGSALRLIVETERDMWDVRGTFDATPFDAGLESLFARKAAVATSLDDDEARLAEFDALEDQTCPPHFELVAEDGTLQDFGLLYVSAACVGFRLL